MIYLMNQLLRIHSYFSPLSFITLQYESLNIDFPRFLTSRVISGFPQWLSSKESTCQRKRLQRGKFDPSVGKNLKEEMAIHSSIVAWRILQTEKPGGLQSMLLQRVGKAEQLSTHTGLLMQHIFGHEEVFSSY